VIRQAHINDVNTIIPMIEEDCLEMGYPFNKEYVTEQIDLMIKSSCLIFVKEQGAKLTGLLAMIISPNLFDGKTREMREFIWYASKDLPNFGRARVMVDLLDFMLFIADEQKIEVHVSLPDVKKTEPIMGLLESRGFKRSEVYFKRGA